MRSGIASSITLRPFPLTLDSILVILVALAIDRILFVLAIERMLAELVLLPIVEKGFDVELEVDVVDPGPPAPIPIALVYEGVALFGLALSSSGVEGFQSCGGGLVPGGERAIFCGGGV